MLEKLRNRIRFDESGGLALWLKKEMKVVTGNKNMIDTAILIPVHASALRIFWVYGAPIFEDRKVVWDNMRKAQGCQRTFIVYRRF